MTVLSYPEKKKLAVIKAFVEAGYGDDNGNIDATKWREAEFNLVKTAKVLKKKDKAEKAILRPKLVKTMFPDLAGEDEWFNEPEPWFAKDVWDLVDQKVWGATTPNVGSRMQRMVGMHMGNGYVMCRTKIGSDQIDAVYITDNYLLMREDFMRPESLATQRKTQSMVRNREMLMARQPEHAKEIIDEYVRTLQVALDAGKAQLELMKGSIDNEDNEDDEDNEG